jgi:uncharacterized protein YjiS (DUF1127 family)
MQFEILWPRNAVAGPKYRPCGRDSKIFESISAEPLETDFGSWFGWIWTIIPMLVGLWSRMHRAREIARIRAAWATVDDRTLRDIGVSRYDIEYVSLKFTDADVIPVKNFMSQGTLQPFSSWQL